MDNLNGDTRKQFRLNIESLINNSRLDEAKILIEEFETIDNNDIEVISMKGIIELLEGNIPKAISILLRGNSIDKENFDLNYNLAYIYEHKGEYNLAFKYYKKASENCIDESMKKEINAILDNIIIKEPNVTKNKEKIVFFDKGDDKFIWDIINELSKKYEIKHIRVTNYEQIDEGMQWADICWFEWCDELVAYGSKLAIACEKEIICRLHSYEAFTNYPNNVNWNNVDNVIFIADHIRNFVVEKFKIDKNKTTIIANGIDIQRYSFDERETGFNIAYVGYINYKKGPMLLLHTFKAIYDKDSRYKLYIAGQFQDDRDVLYFKQMIKVFGIEKNVFYEGWQDNLDKWLEDKNYILCTSILESQNVSVMQAMAKGIKPIIHNFVGAKAIYNNDYVWDTINEAVSILQDKNYNSKEYFQFIKDNYSIEKELNSLNELLTFNKKNNNSKDNFKNKPLVTVGITNYNGKQYLEKCIESFLNQTYSNIEILLIDDCSTDGSKEVIQKYEKNHKNVKGIYHEVNSGGASKGIQEIIENANGKYYQWIACDDFVEKNTVEMFVGYLEKNQGKDYVYSNFNIVDEIGTKTSEWNYKVLDPNNAIRHIFCNASGIIPMNCMYRLEFFRKNKLSWIIYRDNDFSADTLNTLQFIKYNWQYGKIDMSLINYRVHSSNLSHSIGKRIKTSISVFDYIIKNFKEEVCFPQVEWKNAENKVQLKNYLIANFYYDQLLKHLSMEAIPPYLKSNVTKEDLVKYCHVFIEEGMSYINDGLKQGNTYKAMLNNLREKYESYME